MPLNEWERRIIREKLGREPNEAEWLVFEAEWSEHCSYKSSRMWLRKLPTTSPLVLRGPGLDAPLIRLRDNVVVSLKIESHNHPSAVDPYNGAATGVGGVVRDILTVGVRPVALLDNLHFGPLDDGYSLWIARNVVRGISDYGNRIGVPVVGGEVWFDYSFARNPIVLVTCVGVGRLDDVVWGDAQPGDLVLLVGNDTGRDGVLGSSFASRELGGEADVSAIQVGNPLMEKLIMDALLDLVKHRLVKAIKDVGGGGLATALSELAAQFNLGITVDLGSLRLRDPGMSPGEVLVSESQERMVVIIDPRNLDAVSRILEKYGVGYDLLGELISDRRFIALLGGERIVDLPIDLIVKPIDEYHEYREYKPHEPELMVPRIELRDALRIMLRSPNIAMKDSIIRVYDHEVGVRTVVKPGRAGAAVLRILEEDGGDGRLGIAIKADSNPRYSYLDPYVGAANSLAKAYRNVVSVGATPVAAVDSVNVGNPGKPDRYWQFVRSIEGLAWMGNELGIPFVGGKVSFYNEDESTGSSIKPVVAVAVLGVIDDVGKAVEGGLDRGADIVLVGDTWDELGGSEYLFSVHGLLGHAPPRPRPSDERLNSRAVLAAIEEGLVVGSMDVGVGGILMTLVKMSIIGGVGFEVDLSRVPRAVPMDEVATAFSETNARYILVTHNADALSSLLRSHGVVHSVIGSCIDGAVKVKWGGEVKVSLSLEELSEFRLRGVP